MKEIFPLELFPKPILDYLNVCRTVTEAPDEFLAAGGLFVLSVLAGNWWEFNGQGLNDYYLLVGATGTAKKTTAQDLASDLVRGVKRSLADRLTYQVKGIGDAESPRPSEAYPLVTHFSVEGLQQKSIGVGTSLGIQMGEYGTLFDVGRRNGQQNTIGEITSLYDGKPISIRTVGRSVDAESYRVSLIAGSTLSWLREFVSEKNVGGGFANRHLVFRATAERILPNRIKIPDSAWKALIKMFSEVIPTDLRPNHANGTVSWSATRTNIEWEPLAQEGWDRLYTLRTHAMRKMGNSVLEECSARELTHATKLAGLRAMADGRKLVALDDLDFGVRLSRWSTRNLIELVLDGKQGLSLYGREATRVVKALEKKSPLSKKTLALQLGGNQREINRSIEHLIIDERIHRNEKGELSLNESTPNCTESLIDEYFGKSEPWHDTSKLEVGLAPEATGGAA